MGTRRTLKAGQDEGDLPGLSCPHVARFAHMWYTVESAQHRPGKKRAKIAGNAMERAMMFTPVLNAAEFQMIYSQQDGSFAENTFWVQRDEAWDTASLLTVAEAFKTWWTAGGSGATMQSHVTTEVRLQQVDGRDNTTDSSPGVVYTTGLPIAGTLAPPTAALGLTMAITAHTGLSGRSYRGRTYIIGLGEANWETFELNVFKSDAAGVLQDRFNALPAAITGADAHSKLVVCSRFHGVDGTTHRPIPRTEGITTPIINYSFHDLLTDFQRRRAPAHNRHH